MEGTGWSLGTKPRFIREGGGEGAEGSLAVENPRSPRSSHAHIVAAEALRMFPGGEMPPEGYALMTLPQGAVAVADTPQAAHRARQALKALRRPGRRHALATVVDWPDMAWRGLHVLDSGPSSLPALLRLVREVLAPHRLNVLVYEIDYSFRFTSHPEMMIDDVWTREQVGELVAACRAEGIRVIPQVNCLGHQSWKQPPGTLLRRHPEFEEAPDPSDPYMDINSEKFYCRSWCPLHPDVNAFVCDLLDEVMDAFDSDLFHAGMDEVFVIASPSCPRCAGKDPAELFAKAVNDIHAHLKKRGRGMLMWGDRFIDGKATGMGLWEASENGTHPAIDLVPKDIIVCDWHYEPRPEYPSIGILSGKGFRVWPTSWRRLDAQRALMQDARSRNDRKVLGILTTIWYPAGRMAGALIPGAEGAAAPGEKDAEGARTVLAGLREAWNPEDNAE
jgi:hypothetical protein